MFQIRSSEELEELSFKVKWQYFEKLTAFIFSENNYDVIQNKVITGQETKRPDKPREGKTRNPK